MNDSFFEGYRGIIEIKKVKENWLVPREGREPDCILANDYKFFRLFPCHKHYAILAIYDEKFRFLEFYIDVIKDVQFDEQEKLPYMQDLYLDIVYTNLDEIIILDEDELEEALLKKEMTLEEYHMVLNTKQGQNMSIIYGKNPVIEAITSGKTINKLYISKGSKDVYDLISLAKEHKIVVVEADKRKLDRMVNFQNSQGVVASITDYQYFEVDDILKEAEDRKEEPLIVLLDKLEDPHNLGAIIRTVECLGAHGVIIPKRKACQVTDTVEKTAAGATSFVKVARVTNMTETIQYLKEKGLWIYGLDMQGTEEIHHTKLTGPIGIVVGNEGEGISRLVKENCDVLVKIPMTGKLNSLNASVSTAIAIYEVLKQKEEKCKKEPLLSLVLYLGLRFL